MGSILLKLSSLQSEEKMLRERLAAIRGLGNVSEDANPPKRDMIDRDSILDQRQQDREVVNQDGASEDEDDYTSKEKEQEDEEPIMLHEYKPPTKTMPHLPDEILIQIFDHVSHQPCAQQALAACSLLSHQYYHVAVPLLYHRPRLYGNKFDPFVRAICPSINSHITKSPLAELVKVLDLGHLVHQASKSVTARLLGRTKGNLEEFIAPQASFGVNCFAPLSKCRRLKFLDLSLVSESPPLPELFKAISHLTNLVTFRMPRAAGFGVHHKASSFPWPENLQSLTLSGGIDAHFLHGVVAFPSTLRSLTIEHCPLAKGFAVTHLLKTAVRSLDQLERVKIAHMPRLSSHALDDVLFLLPGIRTLSVSVDYVTPAFFDEGHFHHHKDPVPTVAEGERSTAPLQHLNLRTLELTNSGSPANHEEKVSPIDIIIAIDEGTVPKLRQVRVAQSLGWYSSSIAEDTEALTDALQEGSRKDWVEREWVFDGMDGERYARANWQAVAGVWIFEG